MLHNLQQLFATSIKAFCGRPIQPRTTGAKIPYMLHRSSKSQTSQRLSVKKENLYPIRSTQRRILKMKTLLSLLMLTNAGLFLFGAIQRAGVRIGPFHESFILPATIVETICGAFLVWGAVAALKNKDAGCRKALIGNLVALGGVLLGMAALASGRGPKGTSGDPYHPIMLGLAVASLSALYFAWSATKRTRAVKSSKSAWDGVVVPNKA
jgi:hypothetical protein